MIANRVSQFSSETAPAEPLHNRQEIIILADDNYIEIAILIKIGSSDSYWSTAAGQRGGGPKSSITSVSED